MEENSNPAQFFRKRNWALHVLVAWAVVASLLVAYLSAKPQPGPPAKPSKRNLIFMVSDGMGPASLSMTRSFRGLKSEPVLTLDSYFIGHSRTRSSNSLITDSAAGATAFACGLKTYNGAIGVDPESLPCGTVFEAAKREGYLTGLVVTSEITDATPASFVTHARDRSEQHNIAAQLAGRDHILGRQVDLMIGGGRSKFRPEHHGGDRHDGRDLIKEAWEDGWTVVENRAEFDELEQGHNASLPLMGLIAYGNVPFDLDRDNSHTPSLREAATLALKALELATQDSEHGFVLMIEGSRIDHAAHINDPATQVHEVLAYDKTFAAVQEFVANSEVETIVVATSDHETGGLTIGRQTTAAYPNYAWYPEALAHTRHSTAALSDKLRSKAAGEKSRSKLEEYVRTQILGAEGLNVDFDEKDVRRVYRHRGNSQDILAQIVSFKAEVGWSTHGHTAVDVNVYGFSKESSRIDTVRGGNENIDFKSFMTKYLDVNTDDITSELRAAWRFGRSEEGQSVDEYHKGLFI